jgi:hypothetical protein
MTELDDRVFCFYEIYRSPPKGRGRAKPEMQSRAPEKRRRHTHEWLNTRIHGFASLFPLCAIFRICVIKPLCK